MQLIINASNGSNGAMVTSSSTTPYIGNSPQCLESISSGSLAN